MRSHTLPIDDPVRIAPSSKLVVALGVMPLAEESRLNFDEEMRVKLEWRLRNPALGSEKGPSRGRTADWAIEEIQG